VCYFGGGSRQSEPGKPARRPALASCEAGCKGMAPSVTFNRWPWGGRNMEMLVLILAIAMVVPFPLEEIVGGYVRLLLVPIGFILIIRWLIKNDQKNERPLRGGDS
jgi:hypothetical protein